MVQCKNCLHLNVCEALYFNLDKVVGRTCAYYKPKKDYKKIVHGKWVWKDLHGDGSLTLCCSECLNTEGAGTANYCNYCGAEMDGEQS